MKLKELDRNGNVAWSPKTCDLAYLAVGTASQQLDSSFSTNAQLEIFKYIPSQNNWDMPIAASVPSESKFSNLLWGNAQRNNGFIVGGTENGAISIYDASKLLENGKSYTSDISRVAVMKEHKGSVNAMDFNKFKPNLLASGSSDSDIFIWDLDKLEEPMTPGNKAQPLEDILSLAWNHKVQHILASTSVHRCQIWDLRKSDSVIKLSDSQMKMKCKKVVWHPDVSTRLCISSEDDHTPVIQLWDLRYIQCPLRTLQKHTKGIVDLDWCVDDSDILMSVGKDRQMICWNMATHEQSSATHHDSSSDVIYEWQLDQEWINEARFCPKHPGVVSISSSDCHIGIYSLLGGRGHVPRELSDTVIDSFPLDLCDDDKLEIEIVKKEAEKAAELQLSPTPSLLKAPKWLKRPIGARFSFGGKLVQFYKVDPSRSRNNSESQMSSVLSSDSQYKVLISQVTSDRNLVLGSSMLVQATEAPESLLSYCQNKVEAITHKLVNLDHGAAKSELIFDRNIWKFIECHLQEDSRLAFMTNLGYSEANFRNTDNLSNGISNCYNGQIDEVFDNRGLSVTKDLHNEKNMKSLHNLNLMPQNSDSERNLSVALMMGNIDTAIDICLQDNRSGEAAILAVSSGRQDLFEKVQQRILTAAAKTHPSAHLISIAVRHNWQDLVEQCDLKDWREALVWLLTYIGNEELGGLCEMLGRRLEEGSRSDSSEYLFAACVCYVCAGSVELLVRCWLDSKPARSNSDLQRLVEMVVLLCKSVGDDDLSLVRGVAAGLVSRYASLVAAQGGLVAALAYLGDSEDGDVQALRHRISRHLAGGISPGIKAPATPFKVTPIRLGVPSQQLPGREPVPRRSNPYNTNNKTATEIPTAGREYSTKLGELLTQSSKPNPISYGDMQTSRFAPNPALVPPMPAKIYQPPGFPLPSSSFARPHPVTVTPIPAQTTVKRPAMYTPSEISPPSNNPLQMPATVMQGNNQNLNKPSWNDPPLLSENYRPEHDKADDNVQQTFYNPASFMPETGGPPTIGGPPSSGTGNQVHPPPAPVPSAAVSRSPELSSDKQHWQASLLALVDLCRQKDTSRQTKVKMDEIQKKLDHLFELLKCGSISPELAGGLGALVALVDLCQYRAALDKVNQVIQTVNFSEAGSFLPSLKMLIQCALKAAAPGNSC